MGKFLSKKANHITPYVAGEQPKDSGVIKLNTNESPFAPSPRVSEAMQEAINKDLRKYPHASGGKFRDQAARYVGVKSGNIFCGNGSDEVLALAFLAFFDEDRPVVTPDISYSFYPVWASLYNITLKTIPLLDDFTINVNDYFNAFGGVVIANPNAPTGIALSVEAIKNIIVNNKDSVVIVDEAYVEFGAESVVDLVHQYDNLLVVRTLSKSQSLAGMRAGFAVGHKTLIEGLNRIKDSFNSYPINRLTEAAAAAALADEAYYSKINTAIIKTRNWTTEQLTKRGFKVLPSKANFVFASPSKVVASTLFEALKQKKIYLRWFNKPRIKDFLRISMGTDEQMQALIKAIDDIQK